MYMQDTDKCSTWNQKVSKLNVLQVGVMHTNYKELGRRIAGPLVVPFLHAMVATLCAIHCHKVPSSVTDQSCSLSGLISNIHAMSARPFECMAAHAHS